MNFVLDLVVASLLITTIFFSWRLSRNMKLLRQSKKEMLEFMGDFSEAVVRAEASINRMKKLNSEIGSELKINLDRGRFLSNDLSFLIQKGAQVADDLEVKINGSKAINRSMLSPSADKDFINRAAKISSGQVDNTPAQSVQPVTTLEPVNKIMAKKKAVEQALLLLTQHNMDVNGSISTQSEAVVLSKPVSITQKQEKQRRLFDALRWNRQF